MIGNICILRYDVYYFIKQNTGDRHSSDVIRAYDPSSIRNLGSRVSINIIRAYDTGNLGIVLWLNPALRPTVGLFLTDNIIRQVKYIFYSFSFRARFTSASPWAGGWEGWRRAHRRNRRSARMIDEEKRRRRPGQKITGVKSIRKMNGLIINSWILITLQRSTTLRFDN